MLIDLHPGAIRQSVLKVLTEIETDVDNLRSQGVGPSNLNEMVGKYFGWAAIAVGKLRYQVHQREIDLLVLTRRFELLAPGTS